MVFVSMILERRVLEGKRCKKENRDISGESFQGRFLGQVATLIGFGVARLARLKLCVHNMSWVSARATDLGPSHATTWSCVGLTVVCE